MILHRVANKAMQNLIFRMLSIVLITFNSVKNIFLLRSTKLIVSKIWEELKISAFLLVFSHL